MREQLLKKLAILHTVNTHRMIVLVTLLTIILGIVSSRLHVTMRWSDLLPAADPRTIEYNRIIEEFKTASNIVIVLQGNEDRIKAFADTLAPLLESAVSIDVSDQHPGIEALRMKLDTIPAEQLSQRRDLEKRIHSLQSNLQFDWIQRVDYKIETDFLAHHAFMLTKRSDLENSRLLYSDPNLIPFITHLNDVLEREYVGQDEALSTREKEDRAFQFLDGVQAFVAALDHTVDGELPSRAKLNQIADRFIIGEPYFLSYDKRCILLIAIPNFTIMEIDRLMEGTRVVQKLMDRLQQTFPDVRTGMTGFIPLAHDEMVYSQRSLGYTSLIAFAAILILLIASFRMWAAPLMAMLNLLVGIIWAVGIVTILVGQLNIMTQMMAVILMGLGIDFSIHLISAFTERRSMGESIIEALTQSFEKTGKGIITGGLTTSFAFLSLLISRSRGMKELGLVTGSGLLAILAATFLVLPILLVLREKQHQKRLSRRSAPRPAGQDIRFGFLGLAGSWMGKHFRSTLTLAFVITCIMLILAMHITFDQNYMNIEPKGLESVALQDTILKHFDLMIDYGLVLAENPESSRTIARACRELPSVALVEDIGTFLPSQKEQIERRALISQLYDTMRHSKVSDRVLRSNMPEFVAQLQRLMWNIMEMQSMAYIGGQDKVESKCSELVGNPDIEGSANLMESLLLKFRSSPLETMNMEPFTQFHLTFGNRFRDAVLKASSIESIALEDLPDSILDRYANASRTQYIVSVYPAGSIWQNAEFLHRFTDDLQRISIRATGMPPIFRALIDIIGKDGRNAIMLTLVIVFILLWIDFRNPKFAGLAMIPLAVGALWMVGLMRLTGMQFTVMNVMGLPLILGIGIDDGVHIVHRWLAEGQDRLKTVFASTGKAILLTSLTTMLAFGSLGFSIWRGFAQLGGALFLGVGACFLTTVLFLSGLMGWMKRQEDRIHPKRTRQTAGP